MKLTRMSSIKVAQLVQWGGGITALEGDSDLDLVCVAPRLLPPICTSGCSAFNCVPKPFYQYITMCIREHSTLFLSRGPVFNGEKAICKKIWPHRSENMCTRACANESSV